MLFVCLLAGEHTCLPNCVTQKAKDTHREKIMEPMMLCFVYLQAFSTLQCVKLSLPLYGYKLSTVVVVVNFLNLFYLSTQF